MPTRDDAHASPPDRLTLRVLAVADAVGNFIEYWGFKAIHGRVWTLLALHTEPMSQIDIAHVLGVSRSLISGAIGELSSYGLVRPTSEKRSAPYVAIVDVWPAISDILRSREWMLMERARNALEAAIEEAELSGEGHFNKDRLEMLLTLTELAQALLRILIALRVPDRESDVRGWFTRARGVVRAFGDVGRQASRLLRGSD